VLKPSLLIAISAVGLCLGSRGVAQDSGPPQGNAQKGKEIFLKDGCYSCHGYDGHGGVAPKLAPRPIPLVAFIAIVRHPPASSMPTYSPKVMSDAELTDVMGLSKVNSRATSREEHSVAEPVDRASVYRRDSS
jgi:mono/diheme cytochrome c family protein